MSVIMHVPSSSPSKVRTLSGQETQDERKTQIVWPCKVTQFANKKVETKQIGLLPNPMILVIASHPSQTTIAPIQVHMWATLVPQLVKNLPAIQQTQVWFLGWGNPLEKGVATHSSILTWRIPWTEERGRLQSMGSQRVRNDWTNFTFSFKSRYRQNI